MENVFSNFSDKTKIQLALSYENDDIIEKFCSEFGCEQELADEYFLEVKKFLYLCANTTHRLAPSIELDKIWHVFILFTKDYRLYCMYFLGRFIDHAPEIKKKNAEGSDEVNVEPLFNTVRHYNTTFGDLNNKIWQVFPENDIKLSECSDSDNYTLCNTGDCTYSSPCEASQPSCVFKGTCFSCTNSGYSCVGENPNNL